MSELNFWDLMTDEDHQALADARRARGWQAERDRMRKIFAERGWPWLEVEPDDVRGRA